MSDYSLLDYLTAKLRFWRMPPEGLPSILELWREEKSDGEIIVAADDDPRWTRSRLRWWTVGRGTGPLPVAIGGALLLAAIAQDIFASTNPPVVMALVFLAAAAGVTAAAVVRGEVELPSRPDATSESSSDWRVRPGLAGAAALASVAAWLAAAGNRAGPVVVVTWLAALGLSVAATTDAGNRLRRLWAGIRDRLRGESCTLTVTRAAVAPALLLGLAMAVRLAGIVRVPAEMLSVHAELILAIVRAGQSDTPIVFPWTFGGLEPVPVYLGTVLAALVGGLSFSSLKLGTVLAGLATVMLVYRLGVEVGGRTVGLWAMALVAVGYWPDVVSRTGFVDGWVPPFAAAALLLLLRAIRQGRHNDFVAAGIVIGLGIQTVSTARSMVPAALALLAVAWFPATKDRRRTLATGAALLLAFTVVAGLPTLAASLHTAADAGLPWVLGAADGAREGSVVAGVPERLSRSLLMPLWSNGPAWDHGGSGRPALDRVAASLLLVGAALAVIGSLRRRRVEDALVVIAVPLLMLPAILARLQPELAPSLLRCAGALAPIFVLTGLGLASVIDSISATLTAPIGRRVAVAAAVVLVGLSAMAGRSIVHGDFAETWDRRAWNASELGRVVRSCLGLGIPLERARVVPYPHWVDTRLVAAEAGFPGMDLAVAPELIRKEAVIDGPRLYLVHPEDRATLSALEARLPNAVAVPFMSRVQGKAFLAVIDMGGAGRE